MHEPQDIFAMEGGAFGSHAPAQGLSEVALNELRAKNVNFVTTIKKQIKPPTHREHCPMAHEMATTKRKN